MNKILYLSEMMQLYCMIICKTMDRVWHNYLYRKCSISSVAVDKISSLVQAVIDSLLDWFELIDVNFPETKKGSWILGTNLYIKLAFAP